MASYPLALTIAGSDSGGCAGIQADIKTFSSLGVFSASVITAITAQNTLGVIDVMAVPSNFVEKQLKAVLEDFEFGVIKIGMLFTKENVFAIKKLYKNNIPLVLDPVMISTSGNSLILDQTIESIIKELFPISTIITPNLNETSILLKREIKTLNQMIDGANDFINKYGVNSVLIKGGHLNGGEMVDVFQIKGNREAILLKSNKIETINTHGTGCTLSSAIAAYLAIGNDLETSVRMGKEYITEAILKGKDVKLGNGHGAVNHFFNPQKLIKI
ncbi:MAG: bifunctional hydroxymethylpyrimidine kinase/phosphomethylpyrimidine kinase [Bacteroidales bacterium]|nr:bifunctional hydroxymethylpyrimidine kinase/phosphomethylpyrimidine kinase [Bacteroidales bacterium]